MYRTVEVYERFGNANADDGGGFAKISRLHEAWQDVRDEDSSGNTADQTLLRDLHEAYRQLYDDQEAIKQDGAHMGRIGELCQDYLA